ncbi:MAG: MmcQ/YjbR family DNA-binding protein, partial [Candidatus Binatia bacterium]
SWYQAVMPIRERTHRGVRSPSEATETRPGRARSLPARPPNTGTHPLKRTRSKAEDRAVERLRRICLALPGVTEKVAWGELTWRVGKIFAQMDTHHHGADHVAVWLAVPPGLQEALVEEDPVRFFRPPYVGHKGWVGVRVDGRPDWKMVASVVRDAHDFITSASRQRSLPR